MKHLLILYFIAVSLSVFSQNSKVIVYAEEGENFTLFVNGEKFNQTPQSRVEAENLSVEFAQVKVEFETSGAPVLKNQLMIERGKEHTAVIKKNKKGKYVMRIVSIDEWQNDPEETEKVKITETRSPKTQTTTTTTTSRPSGEKATIGINVSDGGSELSFNLNVNVSDEMASSETTSVEETVIQEESCAAMTGENFQRAKQSIAAKSFGDEKMTVFKQIIRNNCVNVDQVVGFMNEFTYEEEKLEVAKLAHEKTIDQANYYQVNDAFTYSDTVEELEAFLKKN